jgi:hypothetical protein
VTNLNESGNELMKKVVEVREGIDWRHVFQTHNRYEKYFSSPTVFRKLTKFFW